jgi:hypothetical protein
MDITEAIAKKVVETVDAGLVGGLGQPVPGQMCVEAAVCYALGLPHGDDPKCVAYSLRSLKIRLNDASWSSAQARSKGLRRLAVAQLGSMGVLDDREFVRRVAEMTIRRRLPVVFRRAATLNPTHAETLNSAALRCEQEGTREAARHAESVARSAYAAAAYAAASASAADAAYDAASASAASAADAAYAASAADAASADAAYAAAAASAAARDQSLAEYAEWVVEILIEMKAPGCQWLTLTRAGSRTTASGASRRQQGVAAPTVIKKEQ